jgi:hypothetical protein
MTPLRKKPIAGLADTIEALRAELSQAIEKGANERMRFRVQPIELTINVVVETGADGKVGWGVLSVGAERKSTRTHQLRILLEPLWAAEEGAPAKEFIIADNTGQEANFGPRRRTDNRRTDNPAPEGKAE